MDTRCTATYGKLLAVAALVASLALASGCSEAQPVGTAEPQPMPEADRREPRELLAPPPTAPAPAPASSAAPLDPAAVSALEAQLRALQPASAAPLPELPERSCAVSFCVRVVDDDADPLRALQSAVLPGGARVEAVNVPAGQPGNAISPRFRFVAPTTSTPAQLAELAALAAPHLPAKRDLAWGVSEDANGRPALTSYLLGAAVVDASDVESARKRVDEGGFYGVDLVLRAEGAERFGVVTGMMLRRRLAILSNGRVHLAPVVQSPIPGGRLLVSFPTEVESDAFMRLLPAKP
jgi:hypothetical protein